MNNNRLPTPLLLAYGAPTLAEQLMIAPVFGILTALYAEHTLATLATIGAMFTIARLFDAVTDPLVGYLSDLTRSRFGPRKPWIAAGALLSMVSIWFYYTPSPQAAGGYFFTWSLLLLLGWTLLVIPYNAWAMELTGDYQDRSRLFAYRNIIGCIGGTLFLIAPLILERWTGSAQFTMELMRMIAIGLVILMPVTVGIALYAVPQGKTVATEPPSLASLLESLRVNKVMRLYMLITFIGGIASGAYAALEFLYISNYLRLGERYAVIGIVQMVLTMASIPLWLAIVRKFGKHRPWALSRLGMLLITPLVIWTAPGDGAFLPMLLMVAIVGISNGAHSVAPQAMMADVIDYDTLKTGVNRAGNYFAFVMLLSKATLAIGAGLALALVGLLGYDPKAISNESAMSGFFVAFVGMPAVLGVVSTLLIYKYPIDERRQKIVRKRLEQRAERAASAAR